MDDQRLERIENKLDKFGDHLAAIDVTLAAQHVSLETHIKRTELLEQEVKPIQKHVDMVNGALKLIGILAMIAAIIEAVYLLVK